MYRKTTWISLTMLALSTAPSIAADAAVKDGTRITKDTKIPAGTYSAIDKAEDGAVFIEGDGITVDFQNAQIKGNPPGQAADEFTGTGVVISGKNITVKNLKVSGYKVGIHAKGCSGLTLEDIDVSGNYGKHLLSTVEAEDNSDWIFPHNNEDHGWIKTYGAGLYVEASEGATIRRVRARQGQNGIIIDRVNDSKIYDNDCSFMTGWGLAMWRSNRNVITRNAFDFCIRGYSHGVYNRGQDSAGILMFEQNSGNIIAENSATHGGDGFFGFAGLEALGDRPAPAGFDHKRKGNNDNLLIANDFSYAAAHGIEMTFSFGNKFIDNRLVGNAICGIWGGYCQDTLIAGNEMAENGDRGYGLERGGVNIDSGRNNRMLDNRFRANKCGVHLWGPPSADFMKKPWGKANNPASADNIIAGNTFEKDQVAAHLRGKTTGTIFANNTLKDVGKEVEAAADVELQKQAPASKTECKRPEYPVFGETRPVGARKHLAGRQNIIMTEWAPYDFEDTIVCPKELFGSNQATFRVLGPRGDFRITKSPAGLKVSPEQGPLPATITVTCDKAGLHPFKVELTADGKPFEVTGTLLRADWNVQFFKWDADTHPEKPGNWTKIISTQPTLKVQTHSIDFKWGGGGPNAEVGSDKFATVAESSITLPAGRYRLWTVSDDGIRVWLDGKKVIEDWAWHPPKENTAEITLEAGKYDFRIEHFEIDGFSQLQFRIDPLNSGTKP
jgi:nitrous oxidase accessory protein NosD